MQLGAFSVSLAVKDLKASRDFYAKFGFEVVGGVEEQNWLILRNDQHTIGLFQGMFEQNIMTFNPGWNAKAEKLDGDFTDVRKLAEDLKASGVELQRETLPEEGGPGSFVAVDPDGNAILIDQHV